MGTSLLDIIPFDDRRQKHPANNNLPDWLPKHEFLMIVVAPAGAGKTTLLLNMLTRLYKKYWNEIYIFSPTIHNDGKWDHIYNTSNILLPLSGEMKKISQKIEDQNSKNKNEGGSNSTIKKNIEKYKKNTIYTTKQNNNKSKKRNDYSISTKEVSDEGLNSADVNVESIIKSQSRIAQLTRMLGKPPPTVLESLHNSYNRYVLDLQTDSSKKSVETEHPNHLYMPVSVENNEKKDKVTKDENVKNNIKKENCFEEYSEETLMSLMEKQDKYVKECEKGNLNLVKNVPRTCWVFDDMVGSGLFNQRRDNAFKKLTVRRRHFYSSLIGVTQAYKEIPKTTRTNANCLILFKIDSDEELQVIYKEYPAGLKWHEWLIIYNYCTCEPYTFMMINLQTSNPDYKICRNFNQPISKAAMKYILSVDKIPSHDTESSDSSGIMDANNKHWDNDGIQKETVWCKKLHN